jgi:hypothetical protein
MGIQRSSELEQLVHDAQAAWERGDEEWFSARLSAHDPIMLGSAPDEDIRGADAVNEMTSTEMANRGSYGFKPSAPRVLDARESGDFGWALAENRWEFEDGSYVPVRGLTIFHREDGTWKAIVSVTAPAISNELLRPGSPVTQPAPAAVTA